MSPRPGSFLQHSIGLQWNILSVTPVIERTTATTKISLKNYNWEQKIAIECIGREPYSLQFDSQLEYLGQINYDWRSKWVKEEEEEEEEEGEDEAQATQSSVGGWTVLHSQAWVIYINNYIIIGKTVFTNIIIIIIAITITITITISKMEQ